MPVTVSPMPRNDCASPRDHICQGRIIFVHAGIENTYNAEMLEFGNHSQGSYVAQGRNHVYGITHVQVEIFCQFLAYYDSGKYLLPLP